MKNENTDFIIGRHPAVMALKSDQEINKVFIQSGLKADAISQIVKLAKERHLVVSNVPKNKLDLMTDRQNHQGVVLAVAAYQYATIDDLFDNAAKHDEDPFFLILDELEDPHNLGAIIRSAEAAGVHGVIIPERRSVSLSARTGKAAAGALEYVPVVRVTNLNRTVEQLKANAVSIVTSVVVGSVVGIVSVILIIRLFGAGHTIEASLLPKSVTTPIAMSISERSGGIGSLTAIVVILTGIFGSIVGPFVLRKLNITSKIAKGLALGSAAHGVGTAKAMEMGAVEGAVSGLAIGLMGLVTTLLVPVIEKIL